MSDTIDLAHLDTVARCDQGAELELLHPATGKPLGVYLTLAGVDSGAHRQALASLAEQRLKRRAMSPDDLRGEDVEIVARCTLAWRGVCINGREVAHSLEAARDLYGRFPWIREQAVAFIADRGQYLRD